MRAEQVATAREQARGGIVAAAVPFLVFVLPATVLVFAASWTGLAGG